MDGTGGPPVSNSVIVISGSQVGLAGARTGIVIPQGADNKNPKTALYGANAILFKSTPEKQLASWLFLKYFTSKDVTAYWSIQSGYLPVRKSAAESDVYKKFFAEMVGIKVLKADTDYTKAYTTKYVCKGVGMGLKK